MIFRRSAAPPGLRDRGRVADPCAGHGGDELSFDWWRDQAYALDWSGYGGELSRDWWRSHPRGPSWWQIADYHRYGWAARLKHPDLTWDEVRCGFRRAYEAGKWDTRDPWGQIEEAMRRGWEQADGAALYR